MSIKVLVADDSITIQKVIGIIFGGDEYSLTIVDNGKTAVDKAAEINPDILLIDALMPGMSGYEVTEQIRATPTLATKPILILTGSFEPFDEERAIKCGADDFIAKPFESQQIITKVKELLKLAHSRAKQSQAAPPPPEPEILAPICDITPPIAIDQTETPQPDALTDIWGAFTPDVEPPPVPAPISPVAAPTAMFDDPDIFAIVAEENDSQLLQSEVDPEVPLQHTGSQWVPIEENTFEFEDNSAPPPAQLFDYAVPVQDSSFGEISFEDDFTVPISPPLVTDTKPDAPALVPDFSDFSAPPRAVETAQPREAVDEETSSSLTVPPPLSLTEEQLKAAIMEASREVIERIVWEVVPDLAEALIREAIRKIKEGV